MYILAQIIGTIALIMLLLSFQKNDKKLLLKYQMASSFLFATQYLFLGAFTGFFMNLMCLIRNTIYFRYKDTKVPAYWLVVVILVMICLGAASYDGPITLLPSIACIIYSIALGSGNLKATRIVEVISCSLYIVYNIKYKAIAGLVSTVIELVSAVVAIFRFDILKKESVNKEEV